MSDWDEFCEDMGVNPGCPDDYDHLLEILENPALHRRREIAPSIVKDDETVFLRFNTFHEAAAWSKSNKGKPFTRSADGGHFVPIGDAVKAPSQPHQSPFRTTAFWLQEPDPRFPDWVPGTFPTTDAEAKEQFTRDVEHQRRTFWRRLKKLVPLVARLSENRSFVSVGAVTFGFEKLTQDCRRAFKFDHLCALNFDQV